MAKSAPHPDLFLAHRALRRDPRAWEEIVGACGGRIYNLCLRFAATPAEAEDLSQEVFLKLYRHLRQYRGEVALVAWALRLSRNLCIDHYRRVRLRRASEVVGEGGLAELAANDDPQRAAQDRERRRLVRSTLDEMSEELATVVILRDLQGFRYDEVASILELPVGTVKSRLSRARRELIERLETRLGLPDTQGERHVAAQL